MARVYGPPSNVTPPKIAGGLEGIKAYQKQCEKYIQDLTVLAKKNGKSDLLGEIYRTPIADGYAQYIVWRTSPLELVHLDIDDGWRAPAALERGLRLADIQQYVAMERRWAELKEERKVKVDGQA